MKRFCFLFLSFVCLFVINAQQQDRLINRSTLPADNLKDIILEVTNVELKMYWDAYIKASDGSIYKRFAEGSYSMDFAKTVQFKDSDGVDYICTFKDVNTSSLSVWVKRNPTDRELTPYATSGPKVNFVDGPDQNRYYIRVTGLPENFHRLTVLVNYNLQTSSGVVVRTFVIGVNRPTSP